MKKLLACLGLVVVLGGLAHAGTPRETFYMGQSPLSNTSINGSTQTTVGTFQLQAVLAPVTVNGNSCRTCLTKFFVQIPTTTIVNVLDGGTTVQAIDGLGLGASGINTVALPEDHLGPMCFTAGNTVTINGTVTNGPVVGHQVINYEGFTWCGGTNNAGN